ncbi:hypothetical protein EGW08_007514, partial [Elysia chlorotica]
MWTNNPKGRYFHAIAPQVGPRACPGESIAKMELFLYLASMIQRFELHPAEPGQLPSLEPQIGMIYFPQPFQLRFVERQPIPLTMTSAWAHRWLWGRAVSVLEGFLVYFLGLSSMYILMAIAVDRYIAISKPLLGAKITKKMAVLSCAMCFVGGFLWSALPLMGWNEYTLEGAGISSSVVWESTDPSYTSYIYAIFFACLVLPLVVMFYAYHGVLRTVSSSSR